MHRTVIDSIQTREDFEALQRHPTYRIADRNAKRFAAAVLMPPSLVIKLAGETYPKIIQYAGYSNSEAVLKCLASELAKRFEVSTLSMSIRLKEWPMRIRERVENAIRDKLPYLP